MQMQLLRHHTTLFTLQIADDSAFNLNVPLQTPLVCRGSNHISKLSFVLEVLRACPITGRVHVKFSVKSASWPRHRRLDAETNVGSPEANRRQ